MLATTRTSALLVTLAAGALAAVTACGPKPEPKPEPQPQPAPSATPAATNTTTPTPSPDAKLDNPAVHVSDEILKACGIPAPNAYFAFDSANLQPQEAHTLGTIVSCFTSGALAGRTLRLVGHADNRGTVDYNMALGKSRADSVAVYLVGKGLSKGKTEPTSRGAEDATGDSEPTWAKDRRVDLLVAPK